MATIATEVNDADRKVQEERQETKIEAGRENASGHDGGNASDVKGAIGAPAFHASRPFEGKEMEQVPADLLAGYLGVPLWRAQSLRQAIMDLQANPALKAVLLLKCQVTADWRLYPLGKADGVMDAVERYFRIMNEEAAAFKIQWQLKKSLLDDPKGMSEARLQKLVCELPTNLKAILQCFEGFFDDVRGLDRLLRHLPLLKGEL